MNVTMKAAVIYNHSLNGMFGAYASEVAEALKKRNVDVKLLTNYEADFIPDNKIDFEFAVFLDKDILCGLRLERLGVRLYNNIGAIETCDDKRRTCEALRGIVPMPETFFMPLMFNLPEGFAKAFTDRIESDLTYPVIAKKAFGSLGRDVYLLKNRHEAVCFIENNYTSPLLFCRYIEESCGRDLRVYMVGDRVAAAMMRSNDRDFRSNIALGGHGTPYEPDERTISVCIDTVRALALDFCGIDMLFENGKPSLVCEVNSCAMFGEINRVCGADIASDIAAYIINDREKTEKSLFTGLSGL